MKMLSFDTNGEFSDNYKRIIGGVLPRPIAFVSTINEDGSSNLAPFSFFTAVSAKPFILGFSPFIRSSDGEKKDTQKNIERQKEFVINIVSSSMADAVNTSSTEFSYGEDEFEKAGFTKLDSDLIVPKRVGESMIQYECKLRDILSYGDQPGCGSFITGEVVKVHIAEDIYDNGRINARKLDPIGRGSGNDWVKYDSLIQLERKMVAQIQK